jgi:peptide/nickel transport system permease protein
VSDLNQQTHFGLVFKNFLKSKPGFIGMVMLFILIILSIFTEFFSPNNPNKVDYNQIYVPPSKIHFFDKDNNFSFRPFVYKRIEEYDLETFEAIYKEDLSKKYYIRFFERTWDYKLFSLVPSNLHFFTLEDLSEPLFLLGSDKLGRDVWSRACLSGRISLTLSMLAVLSSVFIGSFVGIVSGYYGGVTDWIIQRIVEIFTALPALPLWIALAALIPPDMDSFDVFVIMIFIFTLLGWTLTAREIRGKVMSFAKTDFINSAKEIGASDLRIIFKHIYPNCMSHIIVVLTLTIPQIILSEAFLSFIGIGIQEPMSSWGFMMKNAQSIETLGSHLWILSPVFFIIFAVLGFNFVGDGIRDAVDPYTVR